MIKSKLAGRELKKRVLENLRQKNFKKGLEEICQLPPRRVVNPLFSFFHHREEIIKWRSVTAMGAVVARLADSDLESARVVMRRLLWNLNDESGGIGWGSAEAMGEIMARHFTLAEEFADILISFIRKNAGGIQNEMLQRGVLWGLGRLAQTRPQFLTGVPPLLFAYLESEDAILRGHAAWIAGLLSSGLTRAALRKLSDDIEKVEVFFNGRLIEKTVGHLAREALSRLDG